MNSLVKFHKERTKAINNAVSAVNDGTDINKVARELVEKLNELQNGLGGTDHQHTTYNQALLEIESRLSGYGGLTIDRLVRL